MKRSPRAFAQRPLPALLCLVALALALALPSLGEAYFWADEGITLLFGKFILRWGVPRVSDEHFASCYGWGIPQNGVWLAHGWLQFYLAAFSQWIFKTSVAGNRLPFVLIGAASVALIYAVGRSLKLRAEASLLASLFLATNVPMILFLRNVRYYALLPFFTLLALKGYVDLTERKPRAWIFLGLGLSGLVHSAQLSFGALVMALITHGLLYHRRKDMAREGLRAAGVVALLYGPLFLYSLPTMLALRSGGSEQILGKGLTLIDFMIGVYFHASALLMNYFPTLLLFALPFVRKPSRWRPPLSQSNVVLLTLVVVSNCVLLSFAFNFQLFPGYVLGAVPCLILLGAALIDTVARERLWLHVTLAALVVFSTALAWPIWPSQGALAGDRVSYIYASPEKRRSLVAESVFRRRIDFPLWNYLSVELVRSYDGPVEAIVGYLQQHAKAGDTFFTTNDQETIYFATGLAKVSKIPFDQPPTWVTRRGRPYWGRGACTNEILVDSEGEKYVNDYLATHKYEAILLEAPNFAQENLPVYPGLHRWSTQGRTWPDRNKVLLFHYRGP